MTDGPSSTQGGLETLGTEGASGSRAEGSPTDDSGGESTDGGGGDASADDTAGDTASVPAPMYECAAFCDVFACFGPPFECGDGSQTLARRVCDGFDDCINGADEADC